MTILRSNRRITTALEQWLRDPNRFTKNLAVYFASSARHEFPAMYRFFIEFLKAVAQNYADGDYTTNPERHFGEQAFIMLEHARETYPHDESLDTE